MLNFPHRFEGWHLIGAFPDGEPDDVGSWLLHHGGEAALLEVPPGLTPEAVEFGRVELGVEIKYLLASHEHEDHLCERAWNRLKRAYPRAIPMRPRSIGGIPFCLSLGGEPLWLYKTAKHSLHDVVTVFRGTAMTGDIELGTLESVNDEVPLGIKRQNMRWLAAFESEHGYRVHSVFSAHLNDVRTNVDWKSLFTVPEPAGALP